MTRLEALRQARVALRLGGHVRGPRIRRVLTQHLAPGARIVVRRNGDLHHHFEVPSRVWVDFYPGPSYRGDSGRRYDPADTVEARNRDGFCQIVSLEDIAWPEER